jgi:acyl-CoA thioesterase-1
VKRLLVLIIFIATASAQAETRHAELPVVLVFGDSISAGYGIHPDQGWVALLQAKLKAEGYGYQVINASVSGETTAGGLARLPRALSLHQPIVTLIELGGNDGLRALPIAQMRENLAQMTRLCAAAHSRPLLLGMRLPPNYGAEYTEAFASSFSQLARDLKAPLVPFLLDGIALNPALMQDDGIHPNAKGQPKLLENVWPALKILLKEKGRLDAAPHFSSIT